MTHIDRPWDIIRLYFKAYSMAILDMTYGLFLFFRKRADSTLIDRSVINRINAIDRSAFPNRHDSRTYDNETDMCRKTGCLRSQVRLYIDDNCYLILIKRFYGIQVYGFAANNGRCQNILAPLLFIKNTARNKNVSCKARECTSYKLIKLLESRNRIKIIRDDLMEMDFEPHHHVIFKIL